jgi:hypothetical protein
MSLNLQAIHDRAEHARQWTERDPCNSDGFLPLPVREHFDSDVPALIVEIDTLRARLAEAVTTR